MPETTSLGGQLTVSAIGFGGIVLTPVYGGAVDDDESLATQHHAVEPVIAPAAAELGVVSVPIPGTRRAARIDEDLASLSVTLTPEQVTTLSEAGNAAMGSRYPDMSSVGSGRE